MKRSLSLLRTYLGPYWRSSTILAILVCTNIGLTVVNPMLLGRFVDAAAYHAGIDAMLRIAFVFLALTVTNQLVVAIAGYVSENVSWLATNKLRADLVEHCLGLDMSFHNEKSPGELIERVDGDVTTLADFFSNFLFNVLANVLLVVGVIIAGFTVDWRLSLVLLVFTLLSVLVLRRTQGIAVPHLRGLRETKADISGFLEERLSATEDIAANGARQRTVGKLDGLLETYKKRMMVSSVTARASSSALEIGVSFASAAVLALGVYLLAGGSMTLGAIYASYSLAQLLSITLFRISYRIDLLQTAIAGMQRITELLFTKSRIDDGKGTPLPDGPMDLVFDKVTFGYTPGKRAVDGVSFELRAGQTLGLLGRTGSGKTTVSRLVRRAYDVGGGAVRVGGVDVREAALSALRERIGVVTQDVQLVHGTIRDNLTFYDSSISDDRIKRALSDLGLDPWYSALPDGLDTVVDGAGTALSAGEAQLLAFARVFLRDPDLVILDEASSRVDPATERLIEQAVHKLLEGRTAIVIAHHLATVQRMHQIAVMEDGKIVEAGPRDDLADDPKSRFSALMVGADA